MSSGEPRGRGLTRAGLTRLLQRLDADPERAGAAYETLRRGLVALFTWRGAATPEECADTTLDRLAARLEEGVEVQDVTRFAHGVARLVLLEHWRRPDARRVSVDELDPVAAPSAPADDDALHGCLDRCLAELPADGRDLILAYYVDHGRRRIEGRRALARGLGVSESALRNRAQRLRDRLEQCLRRCLAPGAANTNGRESSR